MTSGGLEIGVADGRLAITQEGRACKFLQHVDQVSFSGERARRTGQDVLIVTERAVFRFTPEGLQLIEVAPGIDLQSQVLDLMQFRPVMREIRPMRPELFQSPDDLRPYHSLPD
jgi:propionate CoA-transferase